MSGAMERTEKDLGFSLNRSRRELLRREDSFTNRREFRIDLGKPLSISFRCQKPVL